MTSVVQCKCGARFSAEPKLAGRTVKCPKCGEPLAIPTDSPATPPPAPTPSQPQRPAPATPRKPLPAKQPAQPAALPGIPIAPTQPMHQQQVVPGGMGLANPVGQQPPMGVSHLPPVPGGAVAVAVLSYVLAGLTLMCGGFGLLASTWMGSWGMGSVMSGPLLSWTAIVLLYLAYGSGLIVSATGLLKRKFWGWVLSLVMAAFAMVNAGFYLWSYMQLLRVVDYVPRVSAVTGAHTSYFMVIGFWSSYAVICFLLLLLPKVSRSYRRRAR